MYSVNLILSILLALSAGTLAMAAPDASTANAKNTNMTITLFGNPDCVGTAMTWGMEPLYDEKNELAYRNGSNDSFPFVAYMLTRATTLQEQLDFSGPNEDFTSTDADGNAPECMVFLETTSPDVNGNPLDANHCYNLKQVAKCVRFFRP